MKLLKLLAALLCICMVFTLAACQKNNADSSDASGNDEPAAPPTDEQLFIQALESYDRYFNAASEVFDAKFPTAEDHGTADIKLTVSELSVFGESATDLIDPSKPLLQGTEVLAGDLVSVSLNASLFDELLRATVYLSETECIADFTELKDQKPIRIANEGTGASAGNAMGLKSAFEKLLDSLKETDALTVTEEGATRIYALRLEEEHIKQLVTDMGLDSLLSDDDANGETDEGNYLTLRLTVENDIPTDLRMDLYNAGENTPAVGCILTTAKTENESTYGLTLLSEGETLLTLDGKITTAEGSVELNATLKFHAPETAEDAEDEPTVQGDLQFDFHARLLQQADHSINLDGTVELRINMEGGAAFIIPVNITGKFTADGKMLTASSVEISTSGAGMFSIAMRYESSFTPGETSVTLPGDAVDMDDVDPDAFSAALQEAYPLTMQAINEMMNGTEGGELSGLGTSYQSEDMSVSATVYDDDSIRISASVVCVDDGNSLTFSYNGKDLGSYAYTEISDSLISCWGVDVESLSDAAEYYGCERILSYTADDYSMWLEIDFYDDEVIVDIYLPFYMNDGTAQILLPDATPLPFDVEIPVDGTSPLRLGSLTLLPFEVTDIV